MSEIKHTPGPWVAKPSVVAGDPTVWIITPVASDGLGWVDGRYLSVTGCIAEEDARLIAAAPCLWEALEERLLNAEQSAFESWLQETYPSGDAESVMRKWHHSSNFADHCSKWSKAIEVLGKVKGAAES